MGFEEKTEVTEIEEPVTEKFTEAEATEEESTETATEESTEEEVTVTEAESEDDMEVTPAEEETTEEFEAESEADVEIESESEETESEENTEFKETEEIGTPDMNSLKYSVEFKNEVKSFEVSLNDKMAALSDLVNLTYSESDNDWYFVDVYDESKIVVMHGWYSGKHYRQSYSVKKEVYSLKGDRVEVFATYLTADEQAQLDSMKQSYAETSKKLAQYEAEPEKIAILESEDYTNLEGLEAFEALKVQENHFELSVEEVKSQCDAMLLEYAKGHKVEFEAKKEEEAPKKTVGFKRVIPESPNKKSGKYGGIFSRNK